MPLDKRAAGLLAALNEISKRQWICWLEAGRYHYQMAVPILGAEPFLFKRSILHSQIDIQPYRNALAFVEEAAHALGRHLIVRPDDSE